MPPENNNKQMETARLLIGGHLRHSAPSSSTAAFAFVHPDDDALNAFIEGRLKENESLPLISHLVDCAACRRMTVELIRFTTEIEPASETSTPDAEQSTSRVRRLLQELAARVIPSSNDDAVFAYQAQQANEAESQKAEATQEEEALNSSAEENDSPEISSDNSKSLRSRRQHKAQGDAE